MSQPPNRKRSIGLKLAIVARQMRQIFDERVERMGVTRAKWVVLAAVASSPGTTQREIASNLEISEVTAGRLIDRICADGLLERRENPQDRRAYRICLTEAAAPVLEKIAEAAEAFETEMFAELGDAELKLFDAILDKISRNSVVSRRGSADRKIAADAPIVEPGSARAA